MTQINIIPVVSFRLVYCCANIQVMLIKSNVGVKFIGITVFTAAVVIVIEDLKYDNMNVCIIVDSLNCFEICTLCTNVSHYIRFIVKIIVSQAQKNIEK